MRVLVTGMSGTGKSTLVAELKRRGVAAYDADDDGFTEAGPDRRWHWRTDLVAELLRRGTDEVVYFAGCSDEQAGFRWDVVVLLSAPEAVIRERLRQRTGNSYGKSGGELALVVQDLAEVEPLLRRSADVVIDTTRPPSTVADLVLQEVADRLPSHPVQRRPIR